MNTIGRLGGFLASLLLLLLLASPGDSPGWRDPRARRNPGRPLPAHATPLLLDLDGDGAIKASNGKWLPHPADPTSKLVEFDMNGDGFVELTEWIGAGDGLLLVYDPKKDGIDGRDLFGDAGGFDHGYEKLKALCDKNGDGKIDGDELSSLSVWQDANGDGKADGKEIQRASELGITLIGLEHNDAFVSHFVQNGARRMIVDWHPLVYNVKRKRP